MLTTENAGALVGNIKNDGTVYKVKLNTSIIVKGKHTPKDSIIELSGNDAKIVIGAGQGELVIDKAQNKSKDSDDTENKKSKKSK